MTDIGFGLINRRTIIVTLFCMVISVSLFNNQLPINTSNAASIFIGIVLFTGYILLFRSAYLMPFALIFSISASYYNIKRYVATNHPNSELQPRFRSYLKFGFLKITIFFHSLKIFVQLLPSLLYFFGKWIDLNDYATYSFEIESNGKLSADLSPSYSSPHDKMRLFVRYFDRAGLITLHI